MSGFIYSTILQWKLDFRNKGILLTYYIIPLVFYLVMGSVFSTINPLSQQTLIQSMTIFSISMGAFFGTPDPLLELFASESKKAYKVANIPLWSMLATNFISALVHMCIVSVIIYISAPIIFKVNLPSNPLSYFLTLLLFITISILIGILIGITAKKISTMTMLSQLVFLPSLLLSGIMFPSNMLPSFFVKISSVFPATHAMKILTASDGITLSLIIPLIAIGIVVIGALVLIYQKALKD